MKKRSPLTFSCFRLLAFMVLFIPASSYTQVPEPPPGVNVGCNGMDGTFHPCGESWTETYNGVEYDCSCPCPDPPSCVPKPKEPEPPSENISPPSPNPLPPPVIVRSGEEGNTTTARPPANSQPPPAAGNTYTGGLKGSTGTRTSGLKLAGAPSAGGLKIYDAMGRNEIAKARVELERMEPATMGIVKGEIAQRQVEPNPWCHALVRSLKTKAPPPPPKMFDRLQPGDVLLVAPDDTITFAAWTGHYIRLFDKLSSWEWKTYASHTLIFLREVKGVKLFLDNIPGEGPRIKTEDQVVGEYGTRAIDVAQPVSRPDGKALWGAARELGIKQITADLKKKYSFLNQRLNKWTNYGLYGDDNMVCSEASRFVLVMAGQEVNLTYSPVKVLLGIYFGPANFYSDKQHFLITPLEKLKKKI